MNKRQRDYYWNQIIERNGTDQCIRCGKVGRDIHHVNGDTNDNRLDNLDILCHSCNKLKSLQRKYLPVTQRNYTPEQQTNKESEPYFCEWLAGKIFEPENNFHYPLRITIDEGAFICKVSPVTIRRYIAKLTDHPSSPYITHAFQRGQMMIWLKGKEPTE